VDIGRLGIWCGQPFWGVRGAVLEAAAELEQLGYSALWYRNAPGVFDLARDLLDATQRVAVATGIASIWTHPPLEAAAAHHALQQAHPGRFVLGLGVSHPHLVDRDEPGRYSKPIEKVRAYLDALDAAPDPVPAEQRVLAALGPRMLALARERSAGAHPYLVPVEHTRRARQVLGEGSLLAPEQGVVLETDPVRARSIARQHLAGYLQAPNYRNNWLRLGFTPDDFADGGSDRLVDELVAWGSLDDIRERIEEHYRAGADHICIQALTADPTALPRAEWRALAALMRS
jgi:probable F420-dependent oxidoreductase